MKYIVIFSLKNNNNKKQYFKRSSAAFLMGALRVNPCPAGSICTVCHSVHVYVNLYRQSGSSNVIGWQLEVGVALNLFSMTRVNHQGGVLCHAETFRGWALLSLAFGRFSNFYHSLGGFSGWQIGDIFLIFSRKQDLTLHANCLHWRWFAWTDKSCFLGKISK